MYISNTFQSYKYYSVNWNPTGNNIISGSSQKTIALWDSEKTKVINEALFKAKD